MNDALGHASADEYEAVADVLRLIHALDIDQRAVALGTIIHMALTVGDIVRTGGSVAPASE
ncbi:hypothetical protein [Kibdelosporangium aridum]|uniref:Uncharacterized protein n=1 Tax=Kibdelosporangium aridum TaxID=2030 RepID=A0A1Y5Y6X1_KIBAR|nr:hypothetical protein [Kibdelosporangium aridum]SMD26487.1 hypothetical protein SAMN05661093_10070 [Kibdelosporangium aridum]